MCGICGIIEHPGASPEAGLLTRLNNRLLHRGPDEGGEWIQGSAGLAMRRLAIIDLAGGHQPMFNEDGSIAIVFNGEIYNFPELRDLLERAGHRFRSHCDTEAIVHLYEQYGPEGLNRLNGMFAIAIWDEPQQQLLLARDRVGKKPLYYAEVNGKLVFSSEMASLLEFPAISREIDTVSLDNYFCLGYVPGPRTIFRQVKQVAPGHSLLWKNGVAHISRYWRLQPQPVHRSSEKEAAAELLQLLRDAVRIRLCSDVPFGALLSGGVDSSLMVGLMSQLMDRPVQTFTIGFLDKTLDESRYARETAAYFGAEHHELIANEHSVIELVDKLTTHFGEPFADASAIPTYLVSEIARKHVTMALSGDGGDEVFGGYVSYQYHAMAAGWRSVPGPVRSVARTLAHGANDSGGNLGRRVRRFVDQSELPVEQAWRHSRSIFSDSELGQLYTPDFASRVELAERGFQLRDAFLNFGAGAPDMEILNHVDYESYLPGDILVKVDRMSMANSIEMRAPLLDYRVAEFAASLPIDSWFRGELQPYLKERLASSRPNPIVRAEYCMQLMERHAHGEPGGIERKLWSILCFLLWYEKFAA